MSVPALQQKKSERNAKLQKEAAAAAAKAITDAASFEKTITDRAQAYEAEYNKLERAAVDNRRKAKANGQIFVPAEENLLFVIRIRGTIGNSPKVNKILQLLRLRQLHNGVFVKVNAATINMLRMIEPFIAYGYPNLKSVRDIIYKRGYGKVSGQRVPLSSNEVVTAGVGEQGLQCVEDVVHEIFTVGPNFKEAANFLWPVKLSSPKGGFRGKKLNHFNEGGACGQQGDKINRLIKKML